MTRHRHSAVKVVESKGLNNPLILAIFNFLNTGIAGAGYFADILAASKLGVFWFLMSSFLSLILTHFSVLFLTRSAEHTQSGTTHSLANYHFGPTGAFITQLSVCLGNWTCVVCHLQIIADFFLSIVGAPRYLTICIVSVCMFPWMITVDISKLERISTVFIVIITFILTVIVSNAAAALYEDSASDSMEFMVRNPHDVIHGLSLLSGAYCLQFNAIPIYLSLDRQRRSKQIQFVSSCAIYVMFVVYLMFGVSGYIVWGQHVNSDFITNLDPSNPHYEFYFARWVAILTQIAMAGCCFITTPILAFESRTNLHAIIVRILGIAEQETSFWRVTGGFAVLLSAAVITVCIPDLGFFLALVGATYCAFIAYLFPSAVFLKTISRSQSRPGARSLSLHDVLMAFIALVSILFGATLLVFGTMVAFTAHNSA